MADGVRRAPEDQRDAGDQPEDAAGEVQHRDRPPASLALQHPELAAEVGDRDRAEREQAGREQAVEAQQPVDRRGGEEQQATHHQGGAQ